MWAKPQAQKLQRSDNLGREEGDRQVPDSTEPVTPTGLGKEMVRGCTPPVGVSVGRLILPDGWGTFTFFLRNLQTAL